MKIVIIGKDGALGGELMSAYKNDTPRGYSHSDLDITDHAAVAQTIAAERPDIVFNCAAYNNVDGAESDPKQADEVNGYAVGKLAAACAGIGATFVHFSTDYVFDGTNQAGSDESAQPNPVNAYGRSKLLGETETQRAGGNYYIIRTAWLFGGQATGTSAKKSFADHIMERAKAGQDIKVVSDQFGTPTYIPDLAAAAYELVRDRAPFGIYHLINSDRASRLQWAQEILNLAGLKAPLTAISYKNLPAKAPRPQYSFLLNTKRPTLRRWQDALKESL
jgi:dTDP-4-dehydrorhamnose reductase